MTFLHETRRSFPGGAFLILFLFTGINNCLAQSGQTGSAEVYQQIYNSTLVALDNDPLVQNGIYYTYPYYNAQGHPFMLNKDFESGSVDFRGKHYKGLSINYELFNQQLILSWEVDGMLQMSLLDPHFVSGFELRGMQFIKDEAEGGVPAYFQVVSANSLISCYYAWYKDRREVHDSGNRRIFSFSERKSRRYLRTVGQLQRYKNNKSFLKILPEAVRDRAKSFMQTNSIQVMEAGEEDISRLMVYCNEILEQEAGEGRQ